MAGGKAPRFTQKPKILQTPEGHLLMECSLEAQPTPHIKWYHGSDLISASGRYVIKLDDKGNDLFIATLLIQDPTASDGGAYKCTASNELGESNANINLNFAGGAADEALKGKGPSFVGKPKIIPKEGGARIIMECRVKSGSKPTATWFKAGEMIRPGGRFKVFFTEEPDQTYLCQLELSSPLATDAAQYKCNIKNDVGETNANLALNFEQEEPPEKKEKIEEEKKEATPKKDRSPQPRESTPQKKELTASPLAKEGTPKAPSREETPSTSEESMKRRAGTPRSSVTSTDGKEDSPGAKGPSTILPDYLI